MTRERLQNETRPLLSAQLLSEDGPPHSVKSSETAGGNPGTPRAVTSRNSGRTQRTQRGRPSGARSTPGTRLELCFCKAASTGRRPRLLAPPSAQAQHQGFWSGWESRGGHLARLGNQLQFGFRGTSERGLSLAEGAK